MKMVEVTKFCSNFDLEKDPNLFPTSVFFVVKGRGCSSICFLEISEKFFRDCFYIFKRLPSKNLEKILPKFAFFIEVLKRELFHGPCAK